MQELQQTRNRPKTPRKSVWLPLVLLIIPTFTFLLFLLLNFGLYLSRGGLLPSASQQTWLHFYLTHQRLLSRMFAIGLLFSGFNSFASLARFRREGPRQQMHRAEGVMPPALYVGGAYLLLAALMVAACLCKVFQGPQSFTHSPILDGPVADGILVIGSLAFILGLGCLVAVTSILTLIELFTRLKRPVHFPDV